MRSTPIAGMTRMMGRYQDEYDTLPVRDAVECYGERTYPVMHAEFRPSPDDMEMLYSGGVLRLTILGTSWPPVRLEADLPLLEPSEVS